MSSSDDGSARVRCKESGEIHIVHITPMGYFTCPECGESHKA